MYLMSHSLYMTKLELKYSPTFLSNNTMLPIIVPISLPHRLQPCSQRFFLYECYNSYLNDVNIFCNSSVNRQLLRIYYVCTRRCNAMEVNNWKELGTGYQKT